MLRGGQRIIRRGNETLISGSDIRRIPTANGGQIIVDALRRKWGIRGGLPRRVQKIGFFLEPVDGGRVLLISGDRVGNRFLAHVTAREFDFGEKRRELPGFIDNIRPVFDYLRDEGVQNFEGCTHSGLARLLEKRLGFRITPTHKTMLQLHGHEVAGEGFASYPAFRVSKRLY